MSILINQRVVSSLFWLPLLLLFGKHQVFEKHLETLKNCEYYTSCVRDEDSTKNEFINHLNV